MFVIEHNRRVFN